jgi:hypothetical protein
MASAGYISEVSMAALRVFVDGMKVKIHLERNDVHVQFHENVSSYSEVITRGIQPVSPFKVS